MHTRIHSQLCACVLCLRVLCLCVLCPWVCVCVPVCVHACKHCIDTTANAYMLLIHAIMHTHRNTHTQKHSIHKHTHGHTHTDTHRTSDALLVICTTLHIVQVNLLAHAITYVLAPSYLPSPPTYHFLRSSSFPPSPFSHTPAHKQQIYTALYSDS